MNPSQPHYMYSNRDNNGISNNWMVHRYTPENNVYHTNPSRGYNPVPLRSMLPNNFEELPDDAKRNMINTLQPRLCDHNQSILNGSIPTVINTEIPSNVQYVNHKTVHQREYLHQIPEHQQGGQYNRMEANCGQRSVLLYPNVNISISPYNSSNIREHINRNVEAYSTAYNCNWYDLPSEIEELIITTTMSNMLDGPIREILTMGLVCKSWNKWLNDNRVWRNFVEKAFGVPSMWFKESSSATVHRGNPLLWLRSIFKDEANWLSVLNRLEMYILQCADQLKRSLSSKEQQYSQSITLYNNHNVDYNQYYQQTTTGNQHIQHQSFSWLYGPLSDYYAIAARIQELSRIISTSVFDHDTHASLNKFFEIVNRMININTVQPSLSRSSSFESSSAYAHHHQLYDVIFHTPSKMSRTNSNSTDNDDSNNEEFECVAIQYHQHLINLAMDAAAHLGGGDWNVFNRNSDQNLPPRDPNMSDDDYHHNPLHHYLHQKKYWGSKPLIWPSTMKHVNFLGDFDDVFVQVINWISSLYGYSSPSPQSLYQHSYHHQYPHNQGTSVSSCVVDLSIHQSIHILPLTIDRSKRQSSNIQWFEPSSSLADRHVGPVPQTAEANPDPQSEYFPGMLDPHRGSLRASSQTLPSPPVGQSASSSAAARLVTPSLLPPSCRSCYNKVVDIYQHFDKHIVCDGCSKNNALYFSLSNNQVSKNQQSQQQRASYQPQVLHQFHQFESDEAMVHASRHCEHNLFFFCADCVDAFCFCKACTKPMLLCQCCKDEVTNQPFVHHHHFTPNVMLEYKEDKLHPEFYQAKKQSIKFRNEQILERSLEDFMDDCKKFYEEQLAVKENHDDVVEDVDYNDVDEHDDEYFIYDDDNDSGDEIVDSDYDYDCDMDDDGADDHDDHDDHDGDCDMDDC